jgi:predicted acylesterase/phospholipase RssA
MNSNPFNFTVPVEGDGFCGRLSRVKGIANDLARWTGASHAIIAGLHMGKSSSLRAIETELHARLKREQLGDPYVLPVSVSLRAMNGALSEQDVLGFFLLRIFQSLSGPFGPAALNSKEDVVSILKSRAHKGQSPTTLQAFEGALGEIVTLLDPLLGPTRIALLIESIEIVSEVVWVDHLFDNLNALVHDGDLRNHIRLVLTGAERLLAIKQQGSPLLTRLLLHFLEPLSDREMEPLFALAPGLSLEARSEVITQSGGHPFVLQHLLHYLWEGGAEQATSETVITEAQRFVNNRSPDLEHWWSSIGEDGQQVYCFLRQAKSWIPRSEIVRALGPQADSASKRLLYYGLISHDGTFKQYRTYGRIFSDWSEGRCANLLRPLLTSLGAETDYTSSRQGVDIGLDAESSSARNAVPESTGNPRALVMKGGSVKGLAYVGALEELDKYYSFNWFVGTSAGAIAAVLLAAGYTTSELEEILSKKNFKDFLDAPIYKWPSNLYFYKGIFQARAFTSWIAKLVAEKLESPVPVLLKDLPRRVTLYASTRGKKALVFDSQDPQTADVPVSHAVRCSMAIPYFFTPEYRNGARVVDGGMQNNFPVDVLLQSDPGVKFVGLYLGPAIYEEEVKEPSLLQDLFSIWLDASDLEALREHHKDTVIIDPRPVSTVDFNISEEEKKFLLGAGRAAAVKFILKHNSADNKASLTQDYVTKAQADAARLREQAIAARFRRKRNLLCLIGFSALVIGILLFVAYWYWALR